jgi:acetyl esterase/lipase
VSRLLGATALAVTLVLLTALTASSSAAAGGCTIAGPFGTGRAQVWLLRPAATPKSVVVFAHGWTATDPNDWHRARFDHLCARGSLVVFPRYQVDGLDTWEQALDGFRRGVQTAFTQLRPVEVPVVAAGFSFGGALVNYYAGNARKWGVPRPYGVLSMFPTTRVPGRSAGTPPKSVRFVLLAGDRDATVGTAGAEDFLGWLSAHPRASKTYRLIRSSKALVAHHESPKEMTAASTRAFWSPIDALVASARDAA